jgi:EAL domain-containing protein (putative c-di-GMP-specific phosphodiesterase class I)
VDGARDHVEVTDVAERLLGVLAEPVHIDGHDITARGSVGIAFHDPLDATGAEDLLRNADAAMYVAKESGKSRYALFEAEMHATALARLELKAELQRAVQEREFTLRYQPIVELATGRISGVEALVRWEHPQRGVISPADFIPLAEDTGLIVPLGRQLLADACRHAAAMHATAGEAVLTMSVNVSARQLQRADLVDDVRAALRDSGIPPSTLVLELTESVMVEDNELAARRMHDLRALGVQLAIDDFGTGYSSLNYLRRFPIDVLKIDQSFVREAHEDAETLALTRAILDLAAVLGLRPVAEGIEVTQQLERLVEMGCGHGQGYLFAAPLPGDEVLALVRGAAGALPVAA